MCVAVRRGSDCASEGGLGPVAHCIGDVGGGFGDLVGDSKVAEGEAGVRLMSLIESAKNR